jgi:hypothetical protein
MCDYSLMSLPNRLAREGEELAIHRFSTGTMGMVCPTELRSAFEQIPARPKTLWAAFCELFDPPKLPTAPAVCIPPGSRLLVRDMSDKLQREAGVRQIEEVTFTQVTEAPFGYRDAICFSNGRQVTLQKLREGQRIRVLSTTLIEREAPIPESLAVAG